MIATKSSSYIICNTHFSCNVQIKSAVDRERLLVAMLDLAYLGLSIHYASLVIEAEPTGTTSV